MNNNQYLKENVLLTNKNILLYNNTLFNEELDYIIKNFCGKIINAEYFDICKSSPNIIIYMCGDIEQLNNKFNFNQIIDKNIIINVVAEFSTNFKFNSGHNIINSGQVPINIFGLGIFFRNFFDSCKDYFNLITHEHNFQSLTESNKSDFALRKGIYLSDVEKIGANEIKYNLLRCSTNLNGPTDNFKNTDKEIIGKVNDVHQYYFKYPIKSNHVLGQVYKNNMDGKKERKAKISKHADKSKDMPPNAFIAFVTFYEDYYNGIFNNVELKSKKSKTDLYDFCYKDVSILTKIRFVLKNDVKMDNMIKQFEITLYPNSVFTIPLSTNRLYTHEIIPSVLPINKIPTRLGYVARCSNTIGIYKDNQIYIHKHGKYFKLEEPTESNIKELKELYLKENLTAEKINYDGFYFSLNKGDYMEPLL